MIPRVEIVLGSPTPEEWPRELKRLKEAFERSYALCSEAPQSWKDNAAFWVRAWGTTFARKYPNGI